MRNLKKILALVLALVMSLSLMVTAGATDFADDGNVSDNYRQAVEVLSELGVFNGDQNGQFNPEKPITRAEVAAIIYRLATGDVGTEGYKTYAPYNQFPDIQSEDWYAGYVTYCANAGYIKGRNTGRFDAKDNVTGYEVLAMILRAVGYDKNNEFVGPNWQLNTASIATERGVLVNILKDGSVRLSDAATRQVVAEMLFRSSLLPQATWNTATLSYAEDGETLAKQNLSLEEVAGVVMANEYADLAGDTPIEAGTTRLDVDGTAYTLDIGSELNDIGELRHAFVRGGTHVLGELEDRGDSSVAEAANDGGEGSKVANVAKGAGLTLSESTTEYFVNFGEDWDYDSPWYIEYSVTFDTGTVPTGINPNNYGANLFANNYIDVYRVKWENGASNVGVGNDEQDPRNLDKDLYYDGATPNKATFTKIIRAGTKITSADLKIMEGIFKGADAEDTPINNNGRNNGIVGYVYGGGTNQATGTGSNANRNLAITMTWNQFYDEYINSGELSYRESDNGEWLKIIDNDGDGVADYVLRTDFVMTTIDRYNNNNDTYTVEYRVDGSAVEIPVSSISDKGHLNVGDVQVMETVAADKLSVRDVVMYTLIDGVYHVSIPTPVKAAVSKVDKTNLTFTCGEDVYNWSGIDERAVNYHDEAVDGVAGTEYNLYLDQFGYIRLYTEAEKGFALLLNAFYDTDERYDQTWKVEVWDTDENKSVDWTLTDNRDGFVDEFSGGYVNDTLDNRGTWTRLREFGQYRYWLFDNDGKLLPVAAPYYGHYLPEYWYEYYPALAGMGYTPDPFWTNVAAYTGNADGLYTLIDPDGMAANTTTYHSYQVDPTSWTVNTQNMDGIANWASTTAIGNTTRIRANSNTVYYYVTNTRDGISVEYWEGYGKYANDARTYGVDRVYAVTAEIPGISRTDPNYYELAQVIVIERTPTAASGSLTGHFALWAPNDRSYPNATYVARSADNTSTYDPRYIYTLGEGSDGFEIGLAQPIAAGEYMKRGLLNFYGVNRNGAYLIENDRDPITGYPIENNYEAHNIAAGKVVSWDGLNHDYDLSLGRTDSDKAWIAKEELSYDIQAYIVTPWTGSSTFGGYDLKLCSNSQHNDRVLYMYNSDDKVAAVINVDASIRENPGNAAIKASLEYLWTEICDEIQYYRPESTATTVKLYGVSLNPGTNATPISWKTAKDFGADGKDAVEVTGPDGIRSWVDVTPSLSNPKAPQTITITTQVGTEAPVTYTVTRSAARSDNDLLDTRMTVPGAIASGDLGKAWTGTGTPDTAGMAPDASSGKKTNVEAWLRNFVPSAGAKVEYIIQVNGYLPTIQLALEDMPEYVKYAHTEDLVGITAFVIAEDGTTAVIAGDSTAGLDTIQTPAEIVDDMKTAVNTLFTDAASGGYNVRGDATSLNNLLDQKLAAYLNAESGSEREHAAEVLAKTYELVTTIAKQITDSDEALNYWDNGTGTGLDPASIRAGFNARGATVGVGAIVDDTAYTVTGETLGRCDAGVITSYLKRDNCYGWKDVEDSELLQCDYTIALAIEVDGETVTTEYTWTWSEGGYAFDAAARGESVLNAAGVDLAGLVELKTSAE